MNPRFGYSSARFYFGLFSLSLIVAVAILLLAAPPDGTERAELMQFVGRFHPLSVHLPIALLMLVPLFELAGRTRYFPFLLPSIDFVLALSICGALGSVVLGWCLSRGGGYSGPLVTQHMWAGVCVAGAAWVCWVLRARQNTAGQRRVYAAGLIATVGLVSFTGYRGGQLSQGENHLTEFMPQGLRSLLGVSSLASVASNSGAGGPATFFGAQIQPLFTGHCVTCHGANKHKAGLRLDSYDAVMHGSKRGPVIKAGEPKASELFHRITLPPTDDDFMPAENKRPLSPNEVKLIEAWISSGASGTLLAADIKNLPAPSANSAAVADVTIEEIDPAAVAKQRAGLAASISQLQQRFPNTIEYQSRSSADLVVNMSLLGSHFGDNDMAALAPISDRIVSADFSNSAITDRSAATIAAMKHLRTLRLMNTKITDATVQALGPLDQLESLSLFGTPVTAGALPALAKFPKLRHIYVSGTKLSADTTIPQEIKEKLVF